MKLLTFAVALGLLVSGAVTAPTATAAPATQVTRYNLIWEPGTDARPLVQNAPLSVLVQRSGELAAQGFGIASIQGLNTPVGRRYDAIFRPSTEGSHPTAVDVTESGLVTELNRQWLLGRRLSFVKHYYDSFGIARYDGIFQPGTDGRRVVLDWSLTSLLAEDTKMRAAGQRLIQSFGVFNPVTKEVRYSAIWMPGSDVRPALFGATWQQLMQANDSNWLLGYRMSTVNLHQIDVVINGRRETRYDATWKPGTDGRPIRTGPTFVSMHDDDAAFRQAGFRLTVLQPYFDVQ